jgi:hypothetical protein
MEHVAVFTCYLVHVLDVLFDVKRDMIFHSLFMVEKAKPKHLTSVPCGTEEQKKKCPHGCPWPHQKGHWHYIPKEKKEKAEADLAMVEAMFKACGVNVKFIDETPKEESRG